VRRPQPTVRLRLTLLYGGLFLATGILLLALMYGLLARTLGDGRDDDGNKPPSQRTGQGGGDGSDQQGPGAAAKQQTVEQQIDDARHEERAAALGQVPVQAGIALVVATAAALLLGWVAAGRVLRPLRDITAHARHASEATLGERIALRGPPDELKELADTIDAMLARLEAAFAAQQRFAAEASHELRTPLAIIRAEADVALAAPDATERERQLASSVRDAVDRSERLVDGLLALARSDSTLRDDARADLAELVGDVVGEHARAADAGGIELDLDLDAATVAGDRTLLWRMVGNLVENAIRYNRPGGWVRVAVATEGSEAVIRVENSGPPVAPTVVAELFEPFRRGMRDRRGQPSGHGLGLAIVRSVAAVHGGSVTAKAREGGGLAVIARIPSAIADTDGPTTRKQRTG
jgi:signal transduction histidine kinase